jgi:hypothetical protein
MPKTRSTDATNWEHLAESYETWLEDGSVLLTLVLRIVRQRLGRGSAVGDVALRDAYNALRAAAVGFADAVLVPGAAADAGREEMEEGAAAAVLAWLEKVAQLPEAWRQLSWTEQDAAAVDSYEELVELHFGENEEIPDVPDPDFPTKRPRLAEYEFEDDAAFKPGESVEGSSDGEEKAAKPVAGPVKKRARVTGAGVQTGPLAAKKVRRSFLTRPY